MTSPTVRGAAPCSAAGGPSGALLLHGFTGTPCSMRRTAERLAARGVTVEAPLLPGHGTCVEDMARTGWKDWSGAAMDACLRLEASCERVAVVGHSMGGTLACWLAQHRPGLAGIAVVNPLVEPFDDEVRKGAADLIAAGVPIWAGEGPDVADAAAAAPGYDETPLAAFLSLCEGAEEVALGLARIRCPVLVLSSRVDHVVSPENGDLLCASVAGPCERVWLERSYHNAMVDFDHEEVESRIVELVLAVTAAAEVEPG